MKRIAILCLVLLFAVAFGGVIAAVASDRMNVEKNYQLNERGQTYGSVDTNVPPEEQVLPELISAIGIDGTRGYVYSSDLSGEQPKNPEEALEYMEKREEELRIAISENREYLRYVPLYKSDGVTVIGSFGIQYLGHLKGDSVDMVEIYTVPKLR